MSYADVRSCREYISTALSQQMSCRDTRRADWVEDERLAVALAANQWATTHGYARVVTVDDVERLEGPAVGHVDYALKLCLYVAEFVVAAAVSSEGTAEP